jgi:6-phosphogluconolactonase
MRPDLIRGSLDETTAFLTRDFSERYGSRLEHHASGPVGSGLTVAISGGSIARVFFPALATLPLDWSRVDFFWVDERAVPPADPESNFHDASALWLQPAGVPEERIHRMRGEDADLEHAAADYASVLRRVAGDPPVLDYVLMGVGPDGHIASLFPRHQALDEMSRLVAVIEDAPKPPPRRLTLTLSVLASARRIVVAGVGESKAEVLTRAAAADSTLPLSALIARAGDRMVMLLVE